jgi:hypothetical protein
MTRACILAQPGQTIDVEGRIEPGKEPGSFCRRAYEFSLKTRECERLSHGHRRELARAPSLRSIPRARHGT